MTTAALQTVRLYGQLGTRFGRTHRIAVSSPAEAVRFLCAMVRGFESYLMHAKDNGMGFSVFLGRRNLCAEELHSVANDQDIRIAPITLGSKQGGTLQVILGVVIIAVSLVLDYWTAGGFGAATSYQTYVQGGIMILGGVIQLLSPHPKTSGKGDKPDNTPNYNFSGIVNTEAQGHPVPVVYGGPKKVGSAVFSAGIVIKEDVYVNTLSLPGGSSPTGFGGHGLVP